MGSYSSIGLVYSDDDRFHMKRDFPVIASALSKICDHMILHYPEDESYECWHEKTFTKADGFIDALVILEAGKMSMGKMAFTRHGNPYHMLISIRGQAAPAMGFLFEIPDRELMRNDYSVRNQNAVADAIIDSIVKLWDNAAFSYAFCDLEADIEFTLSEIQRRAEAEYSVLVYKDATGRPAVRYGSWCIDGFTRREWKGEV